MRPNGARHRAATAGLIALIVAVTAPACSASHYQQASCRTHRQSIAVLQAQAVPSASLIPCILAVPRGWRFGGSEVRPGLARFWLNSDRVGIHAVESTLTRSCDASRAIAVPLKSAPIGLRRFDEPTTEHPHSGISYFVFRGGCVTYRLSFSKQDAPAVFDEADRILGFTPRSLYVRGNLRDVGLILCGADAPRCPG
jgi:hypothetical protein